MSTDSVAEHAQHEAWLMDERFVFDVPAMATPDETETPLGIPGEQAGPLSEENARAAPGAVVGVPEEDVPILIARIELALQTIQIALAEIGRVHGKAG